MSNSVTADDLSGLHAFWHDEWDTLCDPDCLFAAKIARLSDEYATSKRDISSDPVDALTRALYGAGPLTANRRAKYTEIAKRALPVLERDGWRLTKDEVREHAGTGEPMQGIEVHDDEPRDISSVTGSAAQRLIDRYGWEDDTDDLTADVAAVQREAVEPYRKLLLTLRHNYVPANGKAAQMIDALLEGKTDG